MHAQASTCIRHCWQNSSYHAKEVGAQVRPAFSGEARACGCIQGAPCAMVRILAKSPSQGGHEPAPNVRCKATCGSASHAATVPRVCVSGQRQWPDRACIAQSCSLASKISCFRLQTHHKLCRKHALEHTMSSHSALCPSSRALEKPPGLHRDTILFAWSTNVYSYTTILPSRLEHAK